jgi:hypothetical protein
MKRKKTVAKKVKVLNVQRLDDVPDAHKVELEIHGPAFDPPVTALPVEVEVENTAGQQLAHEGKLWWEWLKNLW